MSIVSGKYKDSMNSVPTMYDYSIDIPDHKLGISMPNI
jgi:hypothetical protein